MLFLRETATLFLWMVLAVHSYLYIKRRNYGVRKDANCVLKIESGWFAVTDPSKEFDNNDDPWDRQYKSDYPREKSDLDEEPKDIKSLLGRIYDSVFFYGLEVPRVSKELRRSLQNVDSNVINNFKRKPPGSPFFTQSEQLAMFLLKLAQSKGAETEVMRDVVRDRKVTAKATIPIPKTAKDKVCESTPRDKCEYLPYDPTSSESLQNYAKQLEKYIANIEMDISFLNVSLETEKSSSAATGNSLSLDYVNILQFELDDATKKQNNAKVELITVTAVYEDLPQAQQGS